MYEDVLIVGIVFGFITFILSGVYRLIRLKMERGGGIEGETFDRLAKAFMQHKKDTERRLQNLEAIITDEGTESSPKKLEEPHKSIEIEDDEQNKTDNRNLRNMLRS